MGVGRLFCILGDDMKILTLNGCVLVDYPADNLQCADLQGANLWSANLRGANLQYEDLRCEN